MTRSSKSGLGWSKGFATLANFLADPLKPISDEQSGTDATTTRQIHEVQYARTERAARAAAERRKQLKQSIK